MTKPVRKVNRAADRLEAALGWLEADASKDTMGMARCIGACQVLVRTALEELQGVTNVEDGAAYKSAAGKAAEYANQPALFEV